MVSLNTKTFAKNLKQMIRKTVPRRGESNLEEIISEQADECRIIAQRGATRSSVTSLDNKGLVTDYLSRNNGKLLILVFIKN